MNIQHVARYSMTSFSVTGLIPADLSRCTLCDIKSIFIKAVVWPHWYIEPNQMARPISLLKDLDVSHIDLALMCPLHSTQQHWLLNVLHNIQAWAASSVLFNTRSKYLYSKAFKHQQFKHVCRYNMDVAAVQHFIKFKSLFSIGATLYIFWPLFLHLFLNHFVSISHCFG